jgi:hypothetical protein
VSAHGWLVDAGQQPSCTDTYQRHGHLLVDLGVGWYHSYDGHFLEGLTMPEMHPTFYWQLLAVIGVPICMAAFYLLLRSQNKDVDQQQG